MKINVFKKFNLVRPVVCGLVAQITSPKGIRELNQETGLYHYRLHTDLKQIYSEAEAEAVELSDGIYCVTDIAKTRDLGIHWNHFLIKVKGDEIELLESYLNVGGSDWIPKALPAIKKYFADLS